MKVYVAARSGNSHKVQLFLSILGVAHEAVDYREAGIDLKGPEFLARNPRGQIPTLETDDGRQIWDSQAILVYLARRYGGEDWLPTDADGMAEVMQWLALSENELLFGLAQARIGINFGARGNTLQFVPPERAQALARRGLGVMEGRLGERDWLALDRPTIAEMACFTYPALAHEAEIDIAAFPAVGSWLDRVRALPGFVAMDGM